MTLPLQVDLIAALWFTIKLQEQDAIVKRGNWATLQQLEVYFGVLARLITVVVSQIARVAKCEAQVAKMQSVDIYIILFFLSICLNSCCCSPSSFTTAIISPQRYYW